MGYSEQQIHEIVISAVASSLACETDEVSATVSLVDELGMDSLDFLDVFFSLEKTLQIKLLGGEINQFLRPDKSPGREDQDPYLTQEEMERLAPFVGHVKAALNSSEKVPRLDLYKLFTAETLVSIVLHEISNRAT